MVEGIIARCCRYAAVKCDGQPSKFLVDRGFWIIRCQI